MSRENFFNILELSPDIKDKDIIIKAIKKKQAQWSKLRNHPSKGRIAQKNLSLLKDIKKIMLDENLRNQEASHFLKLAKKNEENIKKELEKQIELLSSKDKIFMSELRELEKKFSGFKNIKSKIKVKIVDDTFNIKDINSQVKIKNIDFLPTLEHSTLQKINASLKILNKRDLYHFLGVKPSLSISEIQKVTEKKYLENNKSASKTAEVTSTSELLGLIQSILSNKKKKELYDNYIIQNKLKKLNELIEISGKNGIIEKEEYLFIYEEGKLNNLNEEIIKKYIKFFANNKNIKVEIPDFNKPIKFRNEINNEKQLFDLIRTNEPRDIEDLLKSNPNININKKNEHGSTPLILATYSGHLKIVKILLENGADINLSSNDKTTPLIWATVGNHTTIVRYLLNNNVDINAKDKHGFTALMWATSKNNENLVNMLLQYNANTQIKNNNQETAYELAKKEKNIKLFYIIKDHKGENKVKLKEKIFEAVDTNNLIYLSGLYGVNLNNITDDENNNILHLAIQKGKLELIEWILTNNKIDINSSNSSGNTPLIEAIIKLDTITVSNLLKKPSIKINKVDNNGYTALIHAVNIEDIYLTKMLLKNNAKMEIEDNNGNRALTIAVWQNKREIVGLLIDNGAKTNIRNKSGKSLLNLAKERKNQAMIEFLSIYITPVANKKEQTSISLDNSINEPLRIIPDRKEVNKPSVASKESTNGEKKEKKKKEKKHWWKFW